jgi:hypothetical protein
VHELDVPAGDDTKDHLRVIFGELDHATDGANVVERVRIAVGRGGSQPMVLLSL